jgi:RodZ C-terminal domain
LFAGTLQPNESKMLEEAGGLDVVIANPSRLEVRLNGEAIDVRGPQGQLADVRIPWPEGKPTISHRQPFEDIY